MSLKDVAASSFPNGILFRSSIVDGITVKEYYENGEIKEKVYYSEYQAQLELPNLLSDKAQKMISAFTIILILVFGVMIFRYLQISEYSIAVRFYLGLWMAFATYYIANLIAVMIFFFGTSEGRSIRRFHGAEHKAVEARRKIMGYPTYHQIEIASVYSAYCTSRKLICRILVYVAKIITIIKLGDSIKFWQLLLVVVLVDFISSFIISATNIDMIFQWIFVGKPTKHELEVAYKGMAGLKAAEEKYLKEYTNNDKSFSFLFGSFFKKY